MLGFITLMMAAAFLPIDELGLLIRICNNLCTVGIEILMLLIYKTEKIFWINGISYEEAVKAGSDRRKVYARKYVKHFGVFTLAFLLFSLIAQLLHIHWGIDLMLVVVGLVGCCLRTMRFKL